MKFMDRIETSPYFPILLNLFNFVGYGINNAGFDEKNNAEEWQSMGMSPVGFPCLLDFRKRRPPFSQRVLHGRMQ